MLYGKVQLKIFCVDENSSMYVTKGLHSITVISRIDNKHTKNMKWIEKHQTANYSQV